MDNKTHLFFQFLIQNCRSASALESLGGRLKNDPDMESATEHQRKELKDAYIEKLNFLKGRFSRGEALLERIFDELTEEEVDSVLGSDDPLAALGSLIAQEGWM